MSKQQFGKRKSRFLFDLITSYSSIRPLSKNEECDLCQTCVDAQRSTNEIILANSTAFTFDHVFLPETTQDDVYRECVYDMIEGCFQGYSASILAYGQTGSGYVYQLTT